MKKFFTVLQKNPLFTGIKAEELEAMLGCLSATMKSYKKNEIIWMAGDSAEKVGIVVEGSVQIIKEDILGNRNILAQVEMAQMFGEAFACAGTEHIPVTVAATEACTIIFADCRRVVTVCSNSCVFHQKLLENMLGILAKKNIILTTKIEHLSKRSIREKAMSYLLEQAQQTHMKTFNIPFNRQELADYLCVDRSALSSELGRMRDEGLIAFNRQEFRLLEEEN